MDWNAAIEKNREALKRVLAMLVAMAGLAGADLKSPSPLWGGVRSGGTLPRYLHRAVLRLLRPAEAAARRLVIVAARGMVMAVVPERQPKTALPQARYTKNAQAKRVVPGPPPPTPPHKGEGDAHVALRPIADVPSGRAAESPSPLLGSEVVRDEGRRLREFRPSFHLFDPLRRFQRRRLAARWVPRISFPGFSDPFPIPRPPAADDPVDAARLALRFAALGRVLDDLPREARRFARWKARRDAGWVRRVWPLRPGRPPGHRPANRGPRHEVHDILDVTHGLAFWALESPDTS